MILHDSITDKWRPVEIGERILIMHGYAVGELGEVVTTCRDGVRVRLDDGSYALAFAGRVAEAERLAA